MRALVVDDDDLIRSNVAEVLSSEGWEVTEAASAERAGAAQQQPVVARVL
jgi:DNA-binding response OmpR family regulator